MKVQEIKEELLKKCPLAKNVTVSSGSLANNLIFIKLDALDKNDYPHGIESNSIFLLFVYDTETQKLDLHSDGHVYLSKSDLQTPQYKYYAMKSMSKVHVDLGGKKFRKTSIKNIDDLINKIATYFNTLMDDVIKYTGGYPYKRGL
jgi:hypothetical protein